MQSTDALACMTRVVGNIYVSDHGQDGLVGLRNLMEVDGNLEIGSSQELTSLSPLGCLERVSGQLTVGLAENLVDLSGLSNLRETTRFLLYFTGALELPAFAPDFSGVELIHVEGNHALVHVDEMANWRTSSTGVSVLLLNNSGLISIAGLNPLFASHPAPDFATLEDLPSLQTLSGLAGLSEVGAIRLSKLPLIADLGPLQDLKSVGYISLNEMPLVSDLKGLDQLEIAETVVVGDCWNAPLGLGMDGLKSLEGLSSLKSVSTLAIAGNDNLVTLDGLDKLTLVKERWAAEYNPLLDWGSVMALSSQVGKAPCNPIDDELCECLHAN